ncbi:GIY-YIG nuclease family protein [Flavobacterium sp.]|uniref:GIY-YIG nuclease family protein n=1 Tax=Flavobacterium sp. TaxID=239 RepID=UPI00248A8C83|nr:hypothetical protein [Flavobacterium sp.]MDI1318099.1 hypothetical protein [Flavobacterium sp.]
MKGSTSFSSETLEVLRLLVKKYSQANSAADQKAVRVLMRKLNFYVSDFGITSITPSVFEGLLDKGFITCNDSTSLRRKFVVPVVKKETTSTITKNRSTGLKDTVEKQLIHGVFKKAELITNSVPDQTGFYCIKLIKGSKLPPKYQMHLNQREHLIIYIGKAEGQTLKKRFLGQELRAKGHGTFFRSIGAVLGFLPELGSLKDALNKNNYKFKVHDEQKIIQWINRNLEVNCLVFQGDFSVESQWIKKHCPLLNDTHNPLKLQELRTDKAHCRKIATQ